MPHVALIRDNPQAGFSRYKFEASCSCQWQALAQTEITATNYIRGHLFRHGESLAEIDKLWPNSSNQ